MTRIILHGCNGHMGRVITDIVKDDPEVSVVAGVDPFTAVENSYPVYSDINDCRDAADVLVDFSSASAIDNLIYYCEAHHLPLVLCTTGLSAEQIERVHSLSTNVAVLHSANMSLGINTILELLKKAAPVFSEAGFDIEIVEKHHNKKLDAPSGTAIALADSINEVLSNEYRYVYDRTSRRQEREAKEIGISAVRGGNIVGEHEVIFAGIDEVITIKHTATSKNVFAKGAVEAAKFLAGKPAGLYDMQDVVRR